MTTHAIKASTYADRQKEVFLKSRFDLRMALALVIFMITIAFYFAINSIGIYGISFIYPHLVFVVCSVWGLRNRFVEYLFQKTMFLLEK